MGKKGFTGADHIGALEKDLTSLGAKEKYIIEDFAALRTDIADTYAAILADSTLKLNKKKNNKKYTRKRNELLQRQQHLKSLEGVNQENITKQDIDKAFTAMAILLKDAELYVDDAESLKHLYTEMKIDLLHVDVDKEGTIVEETKAFNTGLGSLETTMRAEISHEALATGDVDEKTATKLRERGAKLEKRETKARYQPLMRSYLQGLVGADNYQEHKAVFKDVTNRLDRTNMSGLLPILQSWLIDDKDIPNNKREMKQALEAEGYIPNGQMREFTYARKLYNYLSEHTGEDLLGEKVPDAEPAAGLYHLFKTISTGTSLADAAQAAHRMQQKETIVAEQPAETLFNLISDINYDGNLVNAPGDAAQLTDRAREQRWESVDKALVMGVSLRRMLKDATGFLMSKGMEQDQAENHVATNIATALGGYIGMPALYDIQSAAALFKIYQEQPYLLAKTQDMLLDQGSDASLLMQYGTGDAKKKIPSYTDVIETRAVASIETDGEILLSPEQQEMIDMQLNEEFTKLQDEFDKTIEQNTDMTEQQKEQAQQFVSSLPENKAFKQQLRLDITGILISLIRSNEGLGVGAGVSHDALNKKIADLTNNAIQQLSLGAGVFGGTEGQFALGVTLNIGASKEFGANGGHRVFYSAGVGAGGTSGGFGSGLYIAPGVEFQTNQKTIRASLDAKAARHIGVVGVASSFGWGGSLYMSKDKIKGYIQGKEARENIFIGALEGVESLDNLSQQTIYQNLQTLFPKTTNTTLARAATNIAQQLRPFADRWADMDDGVKRHILQDLGARYALSWYNKNIEGLEENISSLHLAQLSAGAQLSRIGGHVFPTAGMSWKWYKESTYSETDESFAAVKERQETGKGSLRQAETIDQSIIDSINYRVELTDTAQLTLETHNDVECVRIPSAALARDGLNLHVHPSMQQYIAYKDGALYVHPHIPTNFVSTTRQGTAEYDLIIGSLGLENTTQVLRSSVEDGGALGVADFEGDPAEYEKKLTTGFLEENAKKLSMTFSQDRFKQLGPVSIAVDGDDGKLSLIIKEKEFPLFPNQLQGHIDIIEDEDSISVNTANDGSSERLIISYQKKLPEKTEIIKGSEKSVDMPTLTPEVETYIGDPANNQELLVLRNGSERTQWQAYRDAIEDKDFDTARELLKQRKDADKLSLDVDISKLNPDDLRALDAAMSIVQLTKNKLVVDTMNATVERQQKAKNLRSKIKLKNEIPGWKDETIAKDALHDKLNAIVAGKEDFAPYLQYFYQIVLGPGRAGENITSSANKILSPEYELFWLLAYNKHILEPRTTILKEKLMRDELRKGQTFAAFHQLREEAVAKIGDQNTYEITQSSGYGMVLGYADDGVIEEKFIPHPEIAADATTLIEDEQIQRYFLNNLPENSPYITQVMSLPQIGSREEAIDTIINGTYGIKATFELGYYGKCFNETIIIKEVSIPQMRTIPGEFTISEKLIILPQVGGAGYYENNTATESVADRRAKTFGVGAVRSVPSPDGFTTPGHTDTTDGVTTPGHTETDGGGEVIDDTTNTDSQSGGWGNSGGTSTGGTNSVDKGEPTTVTGKQDSEQSGTFTSPEVTKKNQRESDKNLAELLYSTSAAVTPQDEKNKNTEGIKENASEDKEKNK